MDDAPTPTSPGSLEPPTPGVPTSSPIEPDDEPTSSRLRDPGSAFSALISWAVIAGVVGLILLANALVNASPMQASSEPSPPAGVLQLLSRYAAGAHNIAPAGQAETIRDDLLATVKTAVATPDDAIRAALLAHGMGATEWAQGALDRVTDPDAEGVDPLPIDTPAERPAYVAEDAQRVRALLDSGAGALSADDRAALIDHHGWFAEYGLTAGLDATNAERSAALAPAQRTLLAVLGLAIVGGIGLLAGIVLFIIFIIRLGNGRLRPRYARPAPGGSVYLETLAIFLVAFMSLQMLGASIASATNVDLSELLMWLLLLVLLWPMYRGARFVEAKYALGWHRGEGVFKEIGAGLAGYLAGLPIVGLGFLATIILGYVMSAISGAEGPPPSHPVVQQAGAGGVWAIVSLYLLASVWAPVVEESVFRGALFHHLRGRFGAVVSAAIVGFIFAIIHPQGILLVPPLMALGFVFSMIREWRGSLIGPMVAHAVHNAILVTMLLTALS